MRDGRVLSRRRPSKPSEAKRSCQRQTQVLDLAVSRMIALVPKPSTVRSTICARQTRALLRRVSLFNESVKPIEIGGRDGKKREMPVRIPQTRTPRPSPESVSGFNCQI